MVLRVVSRRVRREAAGRAVLEALIDRQDHHLAGAGQPALHQDAGQVRLGPRVVALVVAQDRFDGRCDFHGGPHPLHAFARLSRWARGCHAEPGVQPAQCPTIMQIQCCRRFREQQGALRRSTLGDVGEGRAGPQDDQAAAEAQRLQRAARRVAAVQHVGRVKPRELGPQRGHQGTPPRHAGVGRRTRRGKQGHWAFGPQRRPPVRQAVDDDGRGQAACGFYT